MRFLFVIPVLWCCTFMGHAQENLVTYSSALEKEIILDTMDSSNFKSLFKMALLTSTSEESAQQQLKKIDLFVSLLDWKPAYTDKPEKKLKNIFKAVHSTFLVKYDETADLNGIFDGGNYQCVTATLLYAYIFESLAIPYQIKEMPTHVYVIAYPETANIMIETTDPQMGYFIPTAKAKNEYITNLIKSKYLDANYVKEIGNEKAFNEFFYGKMNITFREVTGLLYYNMTSNLVEKEDYPGAFSAIYKTNKLYSAKKHEFMQLAVLADLINKIKLENTSDWEAVTYFTNNAKSEDAKSYLSFKFREYVDKYMWKSTHKEKVDSVFNYLNMHVLDSALKNDLENHYLQEASRYLLVSGQGDKAGEYLEKSVSRYPENAITRALLSSYVLKYVVKPEDTESNIDRLDVWTTKFPYLAKDENLQYVYLLVYAKLWSDDYYYGKRTMVEKYYNLLLNRLQIYGLGRTDVENPAPNIFMGMALFYKENKFNKEKALKTITEGLKYFPGNKMLIGYKESIESAKHI